MTSDMQLKEQILDYLGRINEEQKRALLLVAQSFAASAAEESIYTDEFVTELHKRANEMQSGKVKGATWEEVKQRAKAFVKQNPDGL